MRVVPAYKDILVEVRSTLRSQYEQESTGKARTIREILNEHLDADCRVTYMISCTDGIASEGLLLIYKTFFFRDGTKPPELLHQRDIGHDIRAWKLGGASSFVGKLLPPLDSFDHELHYKATGANHVSLVMPPQILVRARIGRPQ